MLSMDNTYSLEELQRYGERTAKLLPGEEIAWVVELKIDGVLTGTLMAAPFQFQVTNAALGPHTLEIIATDAAAQITTQTVTVTVANAGGGGGGTGSGEGEGYDDNTVYGGCSTGSGAGLSFALLGLIGLLRRRR